MKESAEESKDTAVEKDSDKARGSMKPIATIKKAEKEGEEGKEESKKMTTDKEALSASTSKQKPLVVVKSAVGDEEPKDGVKVDPTKTVNDKDTNVSAEKKTVKESVVSLDSEKKKGLGSEK